MKPNAVYYYVSAVLYAGLGLYLMLGDLGNLAFIERTKLWFGIILICLGIFRASRGWQMQRKERRS